MYPTLQLLTEAPTKGDQYAHRELLGSSDAPATATMKRAKQIVDIIKKECKPFLSQWDYLPMYRGDDGFSPHTFASRKAVRPDRKPKDSSKTLHKTLDAAFDEAGFVANRSNSIFCSGDKWTADEYGNLTIVFPVGKFHFTWSSKVTDATSEMDREDLDSEENHLMAVASALHDDHDAVDYVPSTWLTQTGKLRPAITPKVISKTLKLTANQKKTLSALLANEEFHKYFVGQMKLVSNRSSTRAANLTNAHITSITCAEIGYVLADQAGLTKSKLVRLVSKAMPYEPGSNSMAVKHGYTNTNLPGAIRSKNEIMVACQSAIYVEPALARHFIIPLLRNKKLDIEKTYKAYYRDLKDTY